MTLLNGRMLLTAFDIHFSTVRKLKKAWNNQLENWRQAVDMLFQSSIQYLADFLNKVFRWDNEFGKDQRVL